MDFKKFANLCSLSYNNEELYRYSIIISVDAEKRQELERMISQLHTFGKRTLNCAIAKKYSYNGHFISQDDIEYLADFYQNLLNYTDKLELAASPHRKAMKDLHYISETERWIPEWIGYYSINTSGVITSYHYDYPYVMSNVPENRSVKVFGQHVQLCYLQEPYTINVARTMYELFVRPLKKSELVVPANGDSNDLRLDNIRIIDRKYINLKKITLLNIETEELIEMLGYEECEKYNLSQYTIRCMICAAKKKGLDYFTLKGQTWLYEVERYYKAA